MRNLKFYIDKIHHLFGPISNGNIRRVRKYLQDNYYNIPQFHQSMTHPLLCWIRRTDQSFLLS